MSTSSASRTVRRQPQQAQHADQDEDVLADDGEHHFGVTLAAARHAIDAALGEEANADERAADVRCRQQAVDALADGGDPEESAERCSCASVR